MVELPELVAHMLNSGRPAPPPRERRVPVALRGMTVGELLHEAERIGRKESGLPSAARRMVLERAREILGGEG